MPDLTIIPKYPVELTRFIRAPASYVENARAPDQKGVYEPWAAFGVGLAINIAFAAYDAHKWQNVVDKETEQFFFFLVAVVNLAAVHGVCRAMGGKSSTSDMMAAFEYLYGFLIPTGAVLMALLMAFTDLFPGIRCRLGLQTFDCDFIPTTTSVIIVSSIQFIVILLIFYMLAVFNIVIARLQKLGTWKVIFAQAVALGVLFVINDPIYALAHALAARFKDLMGWLMG